MSFCVRLLTAVFFFAVAPTVRLLACGYCGGTAAIRATPVGGSWSSPATWEGGVLPAAGAPVVIPAGAQALLDVATPALRSLKITGVLTASSTLDTAITAGWVMIRQTNGGKLMGSGRFLYVL
jgi:hypothetical protein